MKDVAKKFFSFIGIGDEDYDDDLDIIGEEDDIIDFEQVEKKEKKSKIYNINTTTQLELVVMQIEGFDEARDIADHLKKKKPVVVNLEKLDREEARRMVDFLSGVIYALDGKIQKIANHIILVAPYNVGIMGDFKDELKNKGIFSLDL